MRGFQGGGGCLDPPSSYAKGAEKIFRLDSLAPKAQMRNLARPTMEAGPRMPQTLEEEGGEGGPRGLPLPTVTSRPNTSLPRPRPPMVPRC